MEGFSGVYDPLGRIGNPETNRTIQHPADNRAWMSVARDDFTWRELDPHDHYAVHLGEALELNVKQLLS